MKTIEEKARAYDEAVNKLRRFIEQGVDPLITRADVQDFFPELAESEGEKVRKEIVRFIRMEVEDEIVGNKWLAWLGKQAERKTPQWMIDFLDSYRRKIGCSLDHDEARDVDGKILCIMQWLEKQGQVKESFISQHEIETCKENVNSLTSEDEKVRKALLELVHDTTGDELWIDYNVHKEEALDWLERQGEQKFEMKTAEESLGIDSDTYNKIVDECIFGEQKPKENKGNVGGISPNWSEEDKGIIEEVVSYLINYSNIVESKEDADRIEYLIDKIQDICPHQKQEWSEEDEQHIDSLLKRLDALCRNKFERTRFAISEDRDWLKSLKLQPKQSLDEDTQQWIDTIIKDYEDLYNTDKDHSATIQAKISILKSLRPHDRWKPSELQLGCLSDAIEHYNSLGYPAPKLKELLDDLKKL